MLFLFAGWVAPEEDWSQVFAPQWESRVLHGLPPIPYLHMTEIRSAPWRDKFGLSRVEAEKRIDEAFSIIDSLPSLYAIGISVGAGHVLDTFAETRVVASSGGSRAFEPDYVCFLAYAWAVLNYVSIKHPQATKVDFVVERKKHVTAYTQEFHSHLSEALAALGEPSLSSLVGELMPGDKDRVPLQAPDVLCWHTARSQRLETMDSDDRRRWSVIANRKGKHYGFSEREIIELASALK